MYARNTYNKNNFEEYKTRSEFIHSNGKTICSCVEIYNYVQIRDVSTHQII